MCHSGFIVDGRKHRFKHPKTGACTNSVEGNNARIAQHVKNEFPQSLRNEDAFEKYLSLHDFRYNRTDNIQQQIFLNCLMTITIVHPPNQPSMKYEPRTKFEDIRYIDRIVDEAVNKQNEKMYLVKWYNLPYAKCSWQHEADFNSHVPIDEWNALTQEDKKKQTDKYKIHLNNHDKKQIKPHSIIDYPVYQIKRNITDSIWSAGCKILKDKLLETCQYKTDESNEIVATVQSGQYKSKKYKIELTFKSNEVDECNCECAYYKNINQRAPVILYCKHITAICIYLSADGAIYYD